MDELKYKEEGIKFEKCNQLIKKYLQTSNQYTPLLPCPNCFKDFPYMLVLQELQVYLQKLDKRKILLPLLLDIDEKEGKTCLNKWRIGPLRICGNDTMLGKSKFFRKTMDFITTKCKENGLYVPTIMIDLLEAGVEFSPHSGYYCGVMRYHLPLILPQQRDCYIMIDGVKHKWKMNQVPLCFDDTFLHSLHNRTNEPRYILLMDILRTFPEASKNQLNRLFVDDASKSHHVQNMIKKCDSFFQI